MRTLTSTLLAAQKKASRIPYIKVEARNKIAGVVRLDWTRLYTGLEDDYYHAVTMPDDGSLIRVRVSLPADGRKLYRQRVANPSPSSDFSSWTYTSQYNCVVVAAASLGAEVSIFWINSSREIRRIKSTDYGSSWGSPELIDYSPTTAIYGLAAAYKPNGDLAIFFADQATLYVKKYVSGTWQSKVAWDKSTGDLSGVAVVYAADWNLLVTGKDTSDDFKLWSLIYGDGGDVTLGTWAALKELATAPSDGDFEYGNVFMDKSDVHRCFYVEKFSGDEAYNRPFWSHNVLDTEFKDSLWHEPVPFNLSSEYGLAMAHHGDYGWLSSPSGVWRASLAEQSLDLTADVLSLKGEIGIGQGKVFIELINHDGRYSFLPAPLDIGCQLAISPGYVTMAGNEVSTGPTFSLESYEYVSSGGKASLFLYAMDGWQSLNNWTARHQFRWNKSSAEMNVKQILEFVLARVGLKLEVISESSVITGYYPDFTVNAGISGDSIIKRLLSFVPDVLAIEGNKSYITNPQSSDSSLYSYGPAHAILEGRYQTDTWRRNRIQVEGYDPVGDTPIIVDSYSWNQVNKVHDRLERIEDKNLGDVTEAAARGAACLRAIEMASMTGSILVPVNCGQQLYDVIDITDIRAGLASAKRRVWGISLEYQPEKGRYEQRLSLGAV